MTADAERSAFLERVRLQVRARHPGVEVTGDVERLALLLRAPGVDVDLPLGALHVQVQRHPAQAAGAIARFVNDVERRLGHAREAGASRPGAVLWCVRTREYLAEHRREADLLSVPLGTTMVAFVAEPLPDGGMQGVPRERWEAAAMTDADIAAVADRVTAERFASVPARIARAAEGKAWRIAADPMFMGSALMVPAVRRALAERAGGDALVAVPDRGVILAMPAVAAAEPFRRLVLATHRESMTPCSAEVLVCDGVDLRALVRLPQAAGPRRLLGRLLGS